MMKFIFQKTREKRFAAAATNRRLVRRIQQIADLSQGYKRSPICPKDTGWRFLLLYDNCDAWKVSSFVNTIPYIRLCTPQTGRDHGTFVADTTSLHLPPHKHRHVRALGSLGRLVIRKDSTRQIYTDQKTGTTTGRIPANGRMHNGCDFSQPLFAQSNRYVEAEVVGHFQAAPVRGLTLIVVSRSFPQQSHCFFLRELDSIKVMEVNNPNVKMEVFSFERGSSSISCCDCVAGPSV